ncbi:unnamed protein product [Didymodactylos carnosus]|uniref:Poly [ADP-ribose] polymerase n=1 Tax=Didymodactylos carnosus TaxID=1234261 RepID=A0A813TQT6_9BILA|nr:unnamed protein product [Didymodactylos carnosus]CAF1017148.1 unnamed protein product [Didymodactylos carnosus]CAF3597476.1 unnamed protein product [Didymodactylos carnosus]CAF3786211.1 unnamed protein product [Didymodactylos carnosus]
MTTLSGLSVQWEWEAAVIPSPTTQSKRSISSTPTVNTRKRSLEESGNDKERGDTVTNKKRAISSKSTQNQQKNTMRTITTVAGKVPVDPECTEVSTTHIYCEGEDVWDCMLNQLLEYNSKKLYYVWMRWGRVGKTGQHDLKSLGPDLDGAKRIFCKKFSDKTKNEWYHRDTFEKAPGKYDYIKLDFNASDVEEKKMKKNVEQKPSRIIPESRLDKRIQDLINLICNIQAMEDTLIEMKYDAQKAPLGKLSMNQIKAGYSALKEIETCIKANKLDRTLVEACNKYYSRIPHDFGMRTPPIIRNQAQLKVEIELLETLTDIEIAIQTLQTDSDKLNPVDQHYEQLHCAIRPVEKTESVYKIINDYLQSTHAKTHQQYKMEIEQIYEVKKENDAEQFKDVGNKMLLWHGSRLTNFAGIIGQGLRIAPPEAPMTGYMFGKGLYFADMSSKSANYCYPTPNKNTGIVLLSEVSLGKTNDLLAADCNADRLPKGTSSVKALGQIAPNPKNFITL